MSRFYVGQMVRVVATTSNSWRFAVGMETRIIGEDETYWVLSLAAPSGCSPEVKKVNAGKFLSPITPPHVAGSWEVIEQLLPNIREGVAA